MGCFVFKFNVVVLFQCCYHRDQHWRGMSNTVIELSFNRHNSMMILFSGGGGLLLLLLL